MRRIWSITALLGLLWIVVAANAGEPGKIHFPNLPGYQTLKCDFHMHTVFSDGLVWPTVRVDEAYREGLDAIALSDHIEYQPHKQDIPTNHNRPFEIAAKQARERGILLIRGAEITRDTPPGHFNAIFLSDINPLDTEEFFDVFAQAQQQQAFVFWNHPDWKGLERGRWDERHETLYQKKQLHGIEICNGNDYYIQAHQYALEKNLTMLGDSDIHQPSPTNQRTATEHRTLTLVFAEEKTLPAIRAALYAGRTAVWCGNRLYGRERELKPFLAECLKVHPAEQGTRAENIVQIENLCELDLELERTGANPPAKIILPARAITPVRIDATATQCAAGLNCRVLNAIVGIDRPLDYQLVVPRK